MMRPAEPLIAIQIDAKTKYRAVADHVLDAFAGMRNTDLYKNYAGAMEAHRLRAIPLHRGRMSVATFKATFGGTSYVYAFAYIECLPEGVLVKYLCTGGALVSQDGEYRPRFVIAEALALLKQNHPREVELAESVVADRMTNGMEISVTIGETMLEKHRCDIMSAINESRLAIYLFVMCWLADSWRARDGVLPEQISPDYLAIINIPAEDEDVAELRHIFSEKGPGELLYVISIGHAFSNPSGTREAPTLGQKLFTLSGLEAARIEDVNYSTWREFYITNLVSRLSIGWISFSFPRPTEWVILQGVGREIFSNPAMIKKYEDSDDSEEITRQLRELDKLNYVDDAPKGVKFAKMSRMLRRVSIFNDSHIKLAPAVLLLIMEHRGHTFMNYPKWAVHQRGLSGTTRATDVLTTRDNFRQVIFDMVFAIHTMHAICKVMHCDLHLNNVTIWLACDPQTMSDAPIPGEVKAVHVGPTNDDIYLVPYFGVYPNIIDFSRSIMMDYQRIEDEFSANIADNYIHDQQERLRQVVFAYMPNETKPHSAEITKLILANPTLMFRIFAPLDYLILMKNLRVWVSDVCPAAGINPAEGSAALVKRIEQVVYNSIVSNLNAAVSGDLTNVDDTEQTISLIMNACFADWRATQPVLRDAKKSGKKLVGFCGMLHSNNLPNADPFDQTSSFYVGGVKKRRVAWENWLAKHGWENPREIVDSRFEELERFAVENDEDMAALHRKFADLEGSVMEDPNWMLM